MIKNRVLRMLPVLAIVGVFSFSLGAWLAAAVNGAREVRPGPKEGTELAIVLIVSPDCTASNDPQMVESWRVIVSKYESQLADGMTADGPTLIGVAVSPVVGDGISFLKRFGTFDEVLAGRNWAGSGSQKYILGQHVGPAVVPQVVILERRFAPRPADGVLVIVEESVVQRRYGLSSIVAWANSL